MTVNGAPVTAPDGGSFFVWDGCEACATTYNFKNFDFSLPGLGAVTGSVGAACQQGVVPDVSFQITNVQVKTVLFLLNYLRPASFIAGWPSHYRLYIRPYNYCSSLSNIFMTIPTLFTAYSVIHYFAPHFTS